MTPTSRRWLYRLSVLLLPLLAAPLHSQKKSGKFNKETLGTELSVTGNTLSLTWDPLHPWSPDLSRGAYLMAEYSTPRGIVSQRLDSGRPSSATSLLIQFHLPDRLTATPQGPVCLYIQTSSQHILPIRHAAPGMETTRFRDAAWDRAATARSTSDTHRQRLSKLRDNVATAQQNVQSAQAAISQSKWQTRESCENIPTPVFGVAQKPSDVFPTSEHEAIARRVCVSRIVWGLAVVPQQVKLGNPSFAFVLVQPPDVDAALLRFLEADPKYPKAGLPLRRQQLAALQADWTKWAHSAHGYEAPLSDKEGSDSALLTIQDFDKDFGEEFMRVRPNSSQIELNMAKKPPAILVAGFLGASLEAYSRCVEDSQKQLGAKLYAWTQMQDQAPQLAEKAHQQLIHSCHAQFTTLDDNQRQLGEVQKQLAAEQAISPAESPSASLPTESQPLNAVACDAHAQP